MPAASDPRFLVLQALRLKGFADTPAIASVAGLDAEEAEQYLDKASTDGHCARRDGRITGWALTPDGRARHSELIAVELHSTGARPAVEDAYHRFARVNSQLLTVCTDWQLKNGALNAHDDPAYDAAVIERLAEVDQVVQPVCASLAAVLGRFSRYGPRLAGALQRVQAGDGDWFAKPLIDSYHTVWFELHEDLLATLGIERSKEGSPA